MVPNTSCQIAPVHPPTHAFGLGEASVIIPARNAEATIGKTLRSLVPDRALLREILLTDDGSDDATVQVARATADRCQLPLVVLRIQAGSAGAARNAGIDRSSGDFLFFLDADDEVLPGSLGLLYKRLRNSGCGVAIGASIRRTEGRPDLLKKPAGYGKNRRENVHDYLTNRMWPIAMESALVRTSAVADLRFPTSANLDEDTCYWAAVLARVDAVTISDPVLLYLLDELRMSDRFTRSPRRTLLAISREFDNLRRFGVDRQVLQWRKAWVALRITRQLLMRRRFAEAQRMLRVVRSHPAFRWTWRAFRYSVRIKLGTLAQQLRRRWMGNTKHKPVAEGPLRTLVLTADPAVPPVSGAELRNWQNAVSASQVGPVTIASVCPLRESPGVYKRNLDIAALSEAGQARGRSVAKRRTSIDIRISRTAVRRLVALVQKFQPDTVIVEGLPLFPLLRYLRPLCRQLILDMHNVESHLSAQKQHSVQRPALSKIIPDDPTRLRRLERKAIGIVDRVWVCSHREEDRIRRLFRVGIPVDVVPNGIPRFSAPRDLPAYPAMERGSPTILFVGHMGYPPNTDAAQRLARREILPRVTQRLPGARLILAGRFPPPAVEALAAVRGVDLIANPQDISARLCRAHLTAIPLRWGGGTRLKVLEAMAWGLPVVASPRAVEGLELVDEHDFMMAETDDEFADRIVALASDLRRIEAFRQAAHAKALRLYGPAPIERAVRKGLGLPPLAKLRANEQ